MAIKKRRRALTEAEAAPKPKATGPLVIVAKPKKPMPEGGMVSRICGDDAPNAKIRSVGLIAQSCGHNVADMTMTIEDRVRLMRTEHDSNNPQETRYRNRVRNRGTAITAMCIVCVGGRKAVTECIDSTCALWAFRFGGDPFYGKRGK